ncbi:IS1096 element passenger TnpR family protein [Polaribacter sp.]|uniref:IS1096 element passenger TnpR family protein n=1 Tax=Polaribacter sp. TaxID=1920175 RepID=UPI0040488D85
MYKIRAILDTQEDIIRTILVDDTINLEELYLIIAKSFGFDGQEMASFYRADEDWNQGEEIPLFNMAEAGEDISMENCILNETLPDVNDKLIYVYDFLNMWTFYVDVVEISSEKRTDLPKTILSVGEVPKEAPEKQFTADDFEDEFDEFSDDDMIDEEFDSFDDIEYPEY